jgi:hypothetical protein
MAIYIWDSEEYMLPSVLSSSDILISPCVPPINISSGDENLVLPPYNRMAVHDVSRAM